MKHYLKIKSSYFLAIIAGQKTFEVRENIDRDFHEGDIMVLEEIDCYGYYTGRKIRTLITYVLDDYNFCKTGYVILGFHIQDTVLSTSTEYKLW